LRFLSGLYPCYFAGVHAFNFFFDRAEPRLSVAPQFFFLRAFSRFSFHVPAFLLRAIMCLLFFRLPQSSEFRRVCFGSSEHLRVNLGAARFFISAHPRQLLFDVGDFFVGQLSPVFFLRAFASFGFDPVTLVLSALPRDFFFTLTQALLFNLHRVVGGESLGLYFRASCFFFCAQPHQLILQLSNFFRTAGRRRIGLSKMLLRDRRQRKHRLRNSFIDRGDGFIDCGCGFGD